MLVISLLVERKAADRERERGLELELELGSGLELRLGLGLGLLRLARLQRGSDQVVCNLCSHFLFLVTVMVRVRVRVRVRIRVRVREGARRGGVHGDREPHQGRTR